MHDARLRSWAPCRLVSFQWFWRMFHWNKFIHRLHTMCICVCMNSPIQTLCSWSPRFLGSTKSSSMSLQAPFFPIHVMHKILAYVSSKTSTEMLLLGHKVHGQGYVLESSIAQDMLCTWAECFWVLNREGEFPSFPLLTPPKSHPNSNCSE